MSNRTFRSKAAVAVAMSAALAAVAVPASAQAYQPRGGLGNGIISCDAPGGRQQVGAIGGAILGGLLGSRISRHEREAGAIGGAALGAAAGSYIGCRQQRQRAAQQAAYYGEPAYGQTASNSYRATTTLRVRSGPGTNYAQVGSLYAGQSFQAVSSQGEWMQLSNGGWVNANYLSY